MSNIPVQQEGESDEAYNRRVAQDIEEEQSCSHSSTKTKDTSVTNETKNNRVAYMKAYRQRAEYKEQKRMHDSTYYTNHKDTINARHKEYVLKHKEERSEYMHNYRLKNKDKIKERKARRYAEHKLGDAVCSLCGKVYHVTNKSTTLCQDCLKQAYENSKNDSWYASPDRLEHRRKMLEWGMITKEQFDDPNIIIHHIDGIRDHDAQSNLIAITRGDHTRIHNYYRTRVKECTEQGITPPTIAEVTKEAITKFNIKIFSKTEGGNINA